MVRRDDVVEEIKNRCNIVDVIGRSVALKKAGSNYKGLCPFHREKTPSFVVSEQKQIFTCFGCGATGDVIAFVQKLHGLTFPEALEKLAAECGVSLEHQTRSSKNRELLHEINRQAARFFYKSLRMQHHPGMAYMMKRGIQSDTMRTFGIGYADDTWDSLYRFLKGRGMQEEPMMELGLLASSSRNRNKYYDKFRGRVMFPIQNASGKVIGFGGRTLDPEGIPKYLNSKESPVFHKKNNLYGLYTARKAVREEDRIVIVEGYMDVIALYQSGIRNVVASLGTALTEQQARLIKRYTKNVVLSYDADQAGQTAALRGSDLLHREGLHVSVLHVTDGKDPDEFIRRNGKSAFLRLVNQALPYAEYHLQALKKQYDMNTMEGRVGFLEAAAGVLRQLEPVEADLYLQRLSEQYRISPAALRAQMERAAAPAAIPPRVHSDGNKAEVPAAEKTLLKLFLTDHHYLQKSPAAEQAFSSEMGKILFNALKNVYKQKEEFEISALEETLTPEEYDALRQVNEQVVLSGHLDEIYEDCTATARMEQWKARERMLITRLSMADEQDNESTIRQLTEELMQIQNQIKLGGK